MSRQIFVFSKLFVVVVLLAIFIKYFGLNSLEKYQEKKVLVTTSQKLEEFIQAPALTICPWNPDSMSSFPPNLTEEKLGIGNPFQTLCGHVEGNASAIVDCIEELAYNLTDLVKLEAKGTFPQFWNKTTPGPVADYWAAEFLNGKGQCLIYQSPNHFGSEDYSHGIVIGLNPDLEYHVFIHDPNFFVLSHNPGLGLNRIHLNRKSPKFTKLTVVERHNIDVPNKRCNAQIGYSFTGRLYFKFLYFIDYLQQSTYIH